ncbi:hypothetical protein PIB30_090095 [Stylosanthes scabra]|uniref:Uncharacterized protein n=1 Tax=Stylosanthes scabra TaxID=79078 RepID=A0ABU6SUK6_9FABA|nr:hypothetical protein [Stylosanthes scabra]
MKKRRSSLSPDLEQEQTTLGEAETVADHWRQEWKELAEEIEEIVQETFRDFDGSIGAVAEEQPEPVAEEQPDPVVEEQQERRLCQERVGDAPLKFV